MRLALAEAGSQTCCFESGFMWRRVREAIRPTPQLPGKFNESKPALMWRRSNFITIPSRPAAVGTAYCAQCRRQVAVIGVGVEGSVWDVFSRLSQIMQRPKGAAAAAKPVIEFCWRRAVWGGAWKKRRSMAVSFHRVRELWRIDAKTSDGYRRCLCPSSCAP
jgi:hypothetical protein